MEMKNNLKFPSRNFLSSDRRFSFHLIFILSLSLSLSLLFLSFYSLKSFHSDFSSSSNIQQMNNSFESSSKQIFSEEEKKNSLNRNFSLIESQPSVHFSLISQFLHHSSVISFFRSSQQLYSIPLSVPIFLLPRDENEIIYDLNFILRSISSSN